MRATDYVLARGLAGLSLRPLAAALDTSPRMLLYDFGSKQELVSAVLAEARRRGATRLAENSRRRQPLRRITCAASGPGSAHLSEPRTSG